MRVKNLLIIIISTISFSISNAQTYTEKYNSLYNRYEYYDSNNKLIGYKKWNSLYDRYDIEYFGDKNKQTSSYIQPINLELLNKTLANKQKSYNNNYELIANKRQNILELFMFLYENSELTQIQDRIEYINKLFTDYDSDNKTIEGYRLDYSSASNTRQILNVYDYYEVSLKKIIKEVQAELVATTDKMNQIISFYNSFNSYPLTVKDGWHMVQSMNKKDFCEERKVYVQQNRVTKYIVDNENRNIRYSQEILYAKTKIKLENSDEFLDLFFLDYLINPNK